MLPLNVAEDTNSFATLVRLVGHTPTFRCGSTRIWTNPDLEHRGMGVHSWNRFQLDSNKRRLYLGVVNASGADPGAD